MTAPSGNHTHTCTTKQNQKKLLQDKNRTKNLHTCFKKQINTKHKQIQQH
jgi:hypothetical protein